MDECLAYFRDALHRPESVPPWEDWWATHEPLVRASFAPVDHMRLKVRRLFAARELLERLGALADPPYPVRLDGAFIDAVLAVKWFERCGQDFRLALPFETARVGTWAEAQESCAGDRWGDAQLEARNDLTAFLHENNLSRFRRWNEITDAAKTACVNPLTEDVWQPFCDRHGLIATVVHSVQWDILAAIMAHEFGDCLGRPAFALHLFAVYRAGHFPCGWRGEWPAGRLVVW